MGRCCLICGIERPHERFGGKGYRARVCDRCRRLPKVEQQRVLFEDEIYGFLTQRNISLKNIERLRTIERFLAAPSVARRATVVREIAELRPSRKKRWLFLRANHIDLLRRAIVAGFISPWEDWDESMGASPFDPWNAPWPDVDETCEAMIVEEANLRLLEIEDDDQCPVEILECHRDHE